MKNLRTSINTGIRSSELGGLTILRILLSQAGVRLMTQSGRFIALNR
jgi:hypothetical protein